MPWCPKCKNEYREGITTCVDCGTELLEELPAKEDQVALYTLEKEEVAQKVIDYFNYSRIDSHYEYSEEEQGYVVYVSEKELKQAKKAFQAFYTVELGEILKKEAEEKQKQMEASSLCYSDCEESTENIQEDEEEKVTSMMYDTNAYEKKSDKSKELKSTAITFFAFGVLGIAFIVLNFFGTLSVINGIVPYILMTVMFVGFVYLGFNSLSRAKKAAEEAVQEEELSKSITAYLEETVTKQVIANMKDASLSDEANFIRVMEGIKGMVIKQFGAMNDSYVDYITEEFYNSRFDCQ